jgi:transcriptional regulator with XRE-family HTH domain
VNDDLLRLADVRLRARAGSARSLRLAAGLSLREVADDVGVAVSTLWRWENGERRPHGAAAIRYAAVLDALDERTRPRRARRGVDTAMRMREIGEQAGLTHISVPVEDELKRLERESQ